MKRNSFFSISCEFYSKSCPSLDSRLIIFSFLISTSIFCMRVPLGKTRLHVELQKRADRADQLVLFFLAGANFWEKHAENC